MSYTSRGTRDIWMGAPSLYDFDGGNTIDGGFDPPVYPTWTAIVASALMPYGAPRQIRSESVTMNDETSGTTDSRALFYIGTTDPVVFRTLQRNGITIERIYLLGTTLEPASEIEIKPDTPKLATLHPKTSELKT